MPKLKIHARSRVSDDVLTAQRAAFPDAPEVSGRGTLAVVGGGASVEGYLDELREWPGDVWGVNYTAPWLRARGVDCFFYTIDPKDLDLDSVGAAVLADHCHPSLVGKADSLAKVVPPMPGPTSAVASSLFCLRYGYDGAVFFGCDSGFEKTSHIYRDDPVPDLVVVECGGKQYRTRLELILQAEQLSSVIREFPDRFACRGIGFLSALVEHGVYDVKQISKGIAEGLRYERAFNIEAEEGAST